ELWVRIFQTLLGYFGGCEIERRQGARGVVLGVVRASLRARERHRRVACPRFGSRVGQNGSIPGLQAPANGRREPSLVTPSSRELVLSSSQPRIPFPKLTTWSSSTAQPGRATMSVSAIASLRPLHGQC